MRLAATAFALALFAAGSASAMCAGMAERTPAQTTAETAPIILPPQQAGS